jgi:hypothetical protein
VNPVKGNDHTLLIKHLTKRKTEQGSFLFLLLELYKLCYVKSISWLRYIRIYMYTVLLIITLCIKQLFVAINKDNVKDPSHSSLGGCTVCKYWYYDGSHYFFSIVGLETVK